VGEPPRCLSSMADPGVPLNVIEAAEEGDAGVVQEWLEHGGGDANMDLSPETVTETTAQNGWGRGARLLLHAVEHGRINVTRVLLAHGADVNYVHRYQLEEPGDEYADTAMSLALEIYNYNTALLLLQNGAGAFPLMSRALLSHDLLRAALTAGARVDEVSCDGMTPEAYARAQHASYVYRCSFGDREFDNSVFELRDMYAKTVAMLEGTRLAGSYEAYVLAPFKDLLRIRSLLGRGRARIGPEAPEAVARLFGGRADATTPGGRARPPTRRRRPPPTRAPGLPDPVFWKVMEYWRAEDLQRPFTKRGGRWCAYRPLRPDPPPRDPPFV